MQTTLKMEDIVAIWYVNLPPDRTYANINWMGALLHINGRYEIRYRFRYAKTNSNPFNDDAVKRWYRVNPPETMTREEHIEKMRWMVSVVIGRTSPTGPALITYELIRDPEESTDHFGERFAAMPFAHAQVKEADSDVSPG